MQCMQPLPITGLLEAEDKNEPQMFTPHKHLASSPTESPVPVEKSKRRRRTLTESHSPHTTLSVRHRNTFDMITSSNSFATPAPQLVDFRQSQSEIESMKLLQEDMFKCMLLKCSGQQKHNLHGLQSLLNCVRKQPSNTEVSAISYIEIRSERADSKATLVKVLSNVYRCEGARRCGAKRSLEDEYNIISSAEAEC